MIKDQNSDQEGAFMEPVNNAIEEIRIIIEKTLGDQTDYVLKAAREEFIEEDYQKLARLKEKYEMGMLTVNEFVRTLTSILHNRQIEKRNRG